MQSLFGETGVVANVGPHGTWSFFFPNVGEGLSGFMRAVIGTYKRPAQAAKLRGLKSSHRMSAIEIA